MRANRSEHELDGNLSRWPERATRTDDVARNKEELQRAELEDADSHRFGAAWRSSGLAIRRLESTETAELRVKL